jgi:hypothetical protein
MDKRLGISEEVSEGVKKQVVELAAHMPYRQAADVYKKLSGVTVSHGYIWEQVQWVGENLQPALAPITSGKGELEKEGNAGLTMDGCMAHIKNEGWKEVKVGVVFETKVGKAKDGKPPAIQGVAQSYVLHLGGPEGFGVKLHAEAQSRGFGKTRQQAVIGDGAAWIWKLARADYATAAHIVDWWHAKQHLHAAVQLAYSGQSHAVIQTQLESYESDLFQGKASLIESKLKQAATKNGLSERGMSSLCTEAAYFETYAEQMQYADFRAANLPIGSGTVESAAKRTKQRCSAAGMHWSNSGLCNLLPLRAAVMSDTFDAVWAQRQKSCP